MGQVCIKEGATRAYHTHCDGNIPGFLNTWQTSGGNLPGIHLLSQNDMVRQSASNLAFVVASCLTHIRSKL